MSSMDKDKIDEALLYRWPVLEGEHRGLRAVHVSGCYLYSSDAHATAHILDLLKRNLPADARLWQDDGLLIRTVYQYDTIMDRFALIFASDEFAPIKDGDVIPRLEFKWRQDGKEVLLVSKRTILHVDKRKASVRFENEDESFVDLVIEDK